MKRVWTAAGLGMGLVAACLAVFGAMLTALWLGVGAVGLLRPRPGPGPGRRRWLLVLSWLGLGLWQWPTPFVEYADRTQALLAAPRWSTRDRAGVWLLNLGMALGGTLVGCPEAALETLLLTLPDRDGDGMRTFHSAFPAGSAQVQAALQGWRTANPRGRAGPLPTRKVAWRYDRMGLSEARYALALNTLTLRGEVDGDGQLLACATVAVSYWPTTSIPMFSVRGRTVALEEGLYWRLQQEGWLLPYDAVWCWEEPW